MGLALVVMLALGASAAPPSEVESLDALQAALPTDPARRAAALVRFAEGDRPALAERLRALRAARAHAPTRARARIVEARVHGAAGATTARAKALTNAAAALSRQGEGARREHVVKVKRADDALGRVIALVRARERRATTVALAPADDAAVTDVTDALAAWGALDDRVQQARARVWLARLRALGGAGGAAPDVAGALAELAAIADNAGGRDGAAVRAEAQRTRARLLEAQGDLEQAALASLGADREAAVDLRRAQSRQGASPYLKSKASLELCRKARAQGVVCGAAEQRRYGGTLHYDYSREPRGAFDAEVNAEVLADYDVLLQQCVRDAFKVGVPITQTVIELEWAVSNAGRVRAYDLRPTRLRGTSYDACLRAAFDVFRYPPYAGEQQHVRLSIEVGGDL